MLLCKTSNRSKVPSLSQSNENNNSVSSKYNANAQLGIHLYSTSSVGPRKTMEDQDILIPYLNELIHLPSFITSDPLAFVGVFDGHLGSLAAEYAKANLYLNIFKDTNNIEAQQENKEEDKSIHQWTSLIRQGFLKTHNNFNSIAKK